VPKRAIHRRADRRLWPHLPWRRLGLPAGIRRFDPREMFGAVAYAIQRDVDRLTAPAWPTTVT
jgi:hypothetical protein